MTRILTRTLLLLTLAAAGWSTGAFAAPIDDAKNAGQVGELATGYIGALGASPSAATTALVNSINAKRRAQYQQIAQRNGISLADVEKLAADKLAKSARPGG